MVICLERGADLHTAQLMLLPLTVSCFSKIQTGFTFLVLAYPGSHGQMHSAEGRHCCNRSCRYWQIVPCSPSKNCVWQAAQVDRVLIRYDDIMLTMCLLWMQGVWAPVCGCYGCKTFKHLCVVAMEVVHMVAMVARRLSTCVWLLWR